MWSCPDHGGNLPSKSGHLPPKSGHLPPNQTSEACGPKPHTRRSCHVLCDDCDENETLTSPRLRHDDDELVLLRATNDVTENIYNSRYFHENVGRKPCRSEKNNTGFEPLEPSSDSGSTNVVLENPSRNTFILPRRKPFDHLATIKNLPDVTNFHCVDVSPLCNLSSLRKYCNMQGYQKLCCITCSNPT